MLSIEDVLAEADLRSKVFEQYDEYSLYAHYLGFEPRLYLKYNSPVRKAKYDEDPSWQLVPSKYTDDICEYYWIDYGCGLKGTIFHLLGIMYGVPHYEVPSLLLEGKLSGEKVTKLVAPERNDVTIDIKVKSKPFTDLDNKFWSQFYITRPTLDLYNVTAAEHYWLYADQKYPKTASDYTYAYLVNDHYKIYRPYAYKKDKFRNNFTERDLEGFAQLKYDSDLLIITKSLKDVMTLREMGYEAVSPRGEHTLVPSQYLRYFDKKYKRIVVFFDNDGKHRAKDYPYKAIEIPLFLSVKDISDCVAKYGQVKSKKLIELLLTP